jgi:hypothetical protein
MGAVQSADNVREAKVFLASRISDEAEHKGVPLSELERKMMYFSDSGWTLDDMAEVNDACAREVNQKEYEKRVGTLIRSLRARLRNTNPDEYETWNWAIRVLRERRRQNAENHYLLKLISHAQPRGEIVKLALTALVVVGVMLLALYLAGRNF